MNIKELSKKHIAVINELKKAHLTSFQILNKIKSISLILVVYNILDELRAIGILKSYTKGNMKYHYVISN